MHESHRDGRPIPEQPRSEPEIIPPGRAGAGRNGSERGFFVHVDAHGNARRASFKAPGPLVAIAALLIVGAVMALVLLLLLGAVLVWIPLAVVVVAALMLRGYLRTLWRRVARRS